MFNLKIYNGVKGDLVQTKKGSMYVSSSYSAAFPSYYLPIYFKSWSQNKQLYFPPCCSHQFEKSWFLLGTVRDHGFYPDLPPPHSYFLSYSVRHSRINHRIMCSFAFHRVDLIEWSIIWAVRDPKLVPVFHGFLFYHASKEKSEVFLNPWQLSVIDGSLR